VILVSRSSKVRSTHKGWKQSGFQRLFATAMRATAVV
jgi:hypothetical protein